MASAAVEMLTVSHCRKMMAFNMDLGLDSDTDTEIVNNINGVEGKRMLSETEEDQDKGHVKKRRKQSKPVRIASSESLSDGESYVENGISDNKTELKVSDDSVSVGKNLINDNAAFMATNKNDEYKMKTNKEKYERPCEPENTFNGENSLLPINLSNAKCSSSDLLAGFVATQIADTNQNQNLEKMRRANESFQEPSFDGTHFEKDSFFSTTSSSPLSFPSVKPVHSLHTPNNPRHSASPVRIFNPEAYCDLCNKEFCNKYFLKTHKANKHGIYSENIGSNIIDALPSLPFINYFSSVSEMLPANSQIPRSVMRKPQLPTSIPQQTPVFLPKPLIANGNSRAFCNICQREFCNKYFVRRHKAKIHGIIDTSFPDTPPGEAQELKNQNDMKSCIGNHDKCEDHELYSSYSDQQGVSPGLPSGLSNDCDKPDCRTNETKTHTLTTEQVSLRQNRETDSEGCISPGLPRNSSPMQMISTVPLGQPDEITRDVDSIDKMKRISITNSEAFCDICCKEYCNKYFLRTHKMRSHGIAQPEWDKRDERLSIFENSMSHGNNQAMPLNLIVGDQSVEKMENDSSDVENGDIYCNVCGQKFKDVFLLKMHMSYSHPQEVHEKHVSNDNSNSVSNEKIFKQKQIIKFESTVGNDSANKTFGSDDKCYGIDFQNSSVMLQCEICHKGFDPSSLEAHIENEHGNLLDDVGTLVEENSNSQVFQREIKYDCAYCQRQFPSMVLLNQHIIECHGTTSEPISTNSVINMKTAKEIEEPTKNQLQSMLNSNEVQATPTSSFCEICKKELCNKYFMKTHMQRMHGISIDNGAHIGGVVCDICNKELCSKYFLRVHKQNSHGIVDEILGLDISRNQSPSTDPSLRPAEQSDLNNRYFSHFTEVCTICSRRFRSMKWLKAHLLNDHGDEGKDKWKEFQAHYELRHVDRYSQEIIKKSESANVISQTNTNCNSSTLTMRSYNDGYAQKFDAPGCQPNGSEDNLKSNVFTTIFNGKSTNTKQYHCSYCPFSTSILAFLFVHERSHTNGSGSVLEHHKKLQCKICSLTFETEDSYEKHCISHPLSEITGSASNGLNINQNEKSYKPSGLELIKNNDAFGRENITKEDPGDLHKTTPYPFKVSVKSSKGKELKSEENGSSRKYDLQTYKEPRQEFGQSELDFVESYNGGISEDSRKGYVSDERPRQEAEVDDEVNVALIQVKESLELIANKTDIPVSFSLPQNHKQVIMQPFVLEDSGQFALNDVKKTGIKKSFLSSIVFLPVTERLTDPVTVSFRLTPTL